MTEQETRKILDEVKIFYALEDRIGVKESNCIAWLAWDFELWFNAFTNYSFNDVKDALYTWLRNDKKCVPPKVGDLLEEITFEKLIDRAENQTK